MWNYIVYRKSANLNLNFSTGTAATYFGCGEIYYVGFVYNLLLFPTVKKFWKMVTFWLSYRHQLGHSVYVFCNCESGQWCIVVADARQVYLAAVIVILIIIKQCVLGAQTLWTAIVLALKVNGQGQMSPSNHFCITHYSHQVASVSGQ